MIPHLAYSQFSNSTGNSGELGPVSTAPVDDMTDKSIKPDSGTVSVPDYSKAFDSDIYRNFPEPSDPVFSKKAGYVATVDLVRLIMSKGEQEGTDHQATNVMFGIKRPYYRIGRDIRVAGSIDFKMKQSLAGMDNLATITVRYDLSKAHRDRTVKMEMTVLSVSYKLVFPFDLR